MDDIPPIYNKIQRVFSFCYVADDVLRSSSGEVIFDKSDQYKYLNCVSFIDDYILKFIFAFGDKDGVLFINEDGGQIDYYRQIDEFYFFEYGDCEISFNSKSKKFKKNYHSLRYKFVYAHDNLPRLMYVGDYDINDITYDSKNNKFEIEYSEYLMEWINKDPFEDYDDIGL